MTQTAGGPTAEDPLDEFVTDPAGFTRRAAEPIVNARVGELESRIGQMQVEQKRQLVIAALDRDPPVSDWRLVNDDPAFIRWLSQHDPLSGERLHDLLIRAFNAGDSRRCAHFFKSFIAQRRPSRERTEHRQPFEQTLQTRRQPTVTVKEADDRRRIWTRQEISQFYADVRRGLFDSRDAEKTRIEAAILQAGREGRVAGVPPRLYGDGQK